MLDLHVVIHVLNNLYHILWSLIPGDCLMSPLVQLLTTDQVYQVSHISVQDLLNVGPTNLVTSGFCYTDVLQKTVNPRRKTKYTAHQSRDIVTTSSKHMIS